MSHSSATLRGVMTPLITPLRADGEIDTPSLRRLIRFQLERGASGFLPLGTSGETTFLTNSKREIVIGTVVDEVNGAVPVLAGIVESSSSRSIELGRLAIAAGADYLVATGPYYGDINDLETVAHFERIAEALPRPIIAYDIPFKTHSKLSPDTILQLAQRQIIRGLKDSSGDFWSFRTITAQLRDSDFSMFTGSDPMVDAALLMGASGAIVGTANIAPTVFDDLYRSAAIGDWQEARLLQERVARIAAIQAFGLEQGTGGDASFTGSLKEALVLMGVIESSTMAGGQKYPDQLRARLRGVLVAEGILETQVLGA
jgi:4-hydroxy-tetrahydrodipicolinate synthase